jgi:hypothetical protein
VRRLLASTVGGALAVVPVGALAATHDQDATNIQANPLTTATQAMNPLELHARASEAREQIREARERALRQHRRRVRRRPVATGAGAATGGPASPSPALQAIAACESGGNPRAIGGGGQFRGKYQFTYATWAAVGGSGDPAAAPEAEQDRRAAILYARSGPGQWPVCGR